MSRRAFANKHVQFATSLFFVPAAAAAPSSLSISLKKKKNEYEEDGGVGRNGVPRVGAVLPLVADAAYFLGHEFSCAAMSE